MGIITTRRPDGNPAEDELHPGQGGIGVIEGQFTLGGHDLELSIHIGQMTRVDAGETEGRSGTGAGNSWRWR